ncbi:MAG: hypothetical protein VKO39_09850 [Cyanobacteriota bacterium]|nr:hypothetical protein [Cyanobacteriota bacterium]
MALVGIATEGDSLQVAEVACAALVPEDDVVHLLAALLSEGIEALAAEWLQLIPLDPAGAAH